MDWLEANGKDEANFIETEDQLKTTEIKESKESVLKKICLMCNACKKKFSNLEQAELHAARTLHVCDDFIEAQFFFSPSLGKFIFNIINKQTL